jgi:hypothetical protein
VQFSILKTTKIIIVMGRKRTIYEVQCNGLAVVMQLLNYVGEEWGIDSSIIHNL